MDHSGVTESALRVSCGGDNYVPIARVANLGKAIKDAKDIGFSIVGAVVEDGEDLRVAKFSFPLASTIWRKILCISC